MPTYEYKCENCQHSFEQFQSITAKPLRKCPACGKNKVQRLIGTGAGIIFKGSGFYETDYRSENYKKAAESEKGKPKSDSKKEGKSEAKESKAESTSTSETKPKDTKDKKKSA